MATTTTNDFEQDLARFMALASDAEERQPRALNRGRRPDGLDALLAPPLQQAPVYAAHEHVEDDKADADLPAATLSTALMWVMAMGLGLGVAMAGFVFRHRVGLLVDRWL